MNNTQVTKYERKLLILAALILVVDDLRHCYESIKTDEKAQNLIREVAPMFGHYSSYEDREKIYSLLKSDQVWKLLPEANKWNVEKKGREQFNLCCGVFYVMLSDKQFQDSIIEMILADTGIPKAMKDKQLAIIEMRGVKTGSVLAAKNNNKLIKDIQTDYKKLLQLKLRESGKIRKNIKTIVKASKPFYFKGALLDSFIKEINTIFVH